MAVTEDAPSLPVLEAGSSPVEEPHPRTVSGRRRACGILWRVGWLESIAGRPRTGTPALPGGPHRWVVVDVETSGLSARGDRVLSVAAVALDEHGKAEREFTSLLDPGCDPGPVHIHGLTRERLRGAPQFSDVLPDLWSMLDGRVVVAHNASFDHGFLAAEAARAGAVLPSPARLCTLALSRRLGLPVANHQLGTLASYWRVPQRRAHDALDDTRVLVDVFAHSASLADRLGLPLPVVSDSHPQPRPYPGSWSKSPCSWRYPGPWHPGAPLVQGMKIVVTGETRMPREKLLQACERAGLDVMASVSRLTNVVVCNDTGALTTKLTRARALGTHVLDEAALVELLDDVRAGVPRESESGPSPSKRPAGRRTSAVPHDRGALDGRRVLVVGGRHDEAAAARAVVAALGGAPAVNLSASVTDVVVLPGGASDRRVERAREAGLRVSETVAALHDRDDSAAPPSVPLVNASVRDVAPSGDSGRALDVSLLVRGAVVDLPTEEHVWTINASWRADCARDGLEVDVVALILDDSDRVAQDEDVVFYNSPVSDGGAVALAVDGDCEQSIRVDLQLLPDHCRRVVVAAALTSKGRFGDVGAVAVTVDAPSLTVATSTLDAATSERTLLLAEVYRRGDVWRLRAVGQGYDHGLAELLTSYGVDVNEPDR